MLVSHARNVNKVSFRLNYWLNYKDISADFVTAREAFIAFATATTTTLQRDKLGTELGFRVGISSWTFELDFLVGFSSWTFEFDF